VLKVERRRRKNMYGVQEGEAVQEKGRGGSLEREGLP
jgi:hypothetical protein